MNKDKAEDVLSLVERGIRDSLRSNGYENMNVKLVNRPRFSSNSLIVKFEIDERDPDQAEHEEFEKNARRIGIPLHYYHGVFWHDGQQYMITSVNPRRKKFPISAVSLATDRSYKFTRKLVMSKEIITNA